MFNYQRVSVIQSYHGIIIIHSHRLGESVVYHPAGSACDANKVMFLFEFGSYIQQVKWKVQFRNHRNATSFMIKETTVSVYI